MENIQLGLLVPTAGPWFSVELVSSLWCLLSCSSVQMSALTPDITDAAAASPTAEASLPPAPLQADVITADPRNIASRMEEAEVEAQLVGALGASERCSPVSVQDFALWMRTNIHKTECCFFDRDKR